jgi:hypothetical protein
MEQIIRETDQLRVEYSKQRQRCDSDFLPALAVSLRETACLSKQPCVESFLKDIERGETGGVVLTNTKRHINAAKDNFFFSVFDSPYFPELGVEACFYDALEVNGVLREKYETNVMAVNIKMASQGFHSRPVVALFPENHVDKVQLSDDRIFYFINKFTDRFFKITRLMIGAITADGVFDRLSAANHAEIEQAATFWVWLHEFHHRQGFLPLPKYLKLKSLKPLAGLEELRVDVSAMLTCLDDSDFPREQAEFVFKFILAERLLRYSVEGIPKPNYDAIASQLLFNYLLENEALHISGIRIHLTDKLTPVLRQFLATIREIEGGIQTKSEQHVKQELLDFTKRYTDFDAKDRDYHHIDYFKQVKELLNV